MWAEKPGVPAKSRVFVLRCLGSAAHWPVLRRESQVTSDFVTLSVCIRAPQLFFRCACVVLLEGWCCGQA